MDFIFLSVRENKILKFVNSSHKRIRFESLMRFAAAQFISNFKESFAIKYQRIAWRHLNQNRFQILWSYVFVSNVCILNTCSPCRSSFISCWHSHLCFACSHIISFTQDKIWSSKFVSTHCLATLHTNYPLMGLTAVIENSKQFRSGQHAPKASISCLSFTISFKNR